MSQGHPMNASLDLGAAVAILASLVGYLPPIAAVLAILWYLLQFWESRTLQSWMQKRTQRKILRLTAQLAALQLHATADAAASDLKQTAKAAAADLKNVTQPLPQFKNGPGEKSF